MGSLFAELCEMTNNGSSRQLVEHKDHRFMGLEKAIKRLLCKWDQLEDWFQERTNKAIRDQKVVPEGLPIADDKETLLQLHGLLQPIASLNTKSQKEDTNQVDVLLSMFRLRTTILDETKPVKDRIQAPSDPHLYYQVHHLTRLTKATRALLANALHKNFFVRYTDQSRFRQTSYIPEMQMLLHPSSKNQDKNLSKIVKLCNEQLIIDPEQPHLRLDEHSVARNVASVKEAVMRRLPSLMIKISTSTSATYLISTQSHPQLDASMVAMLELPSLQPQTVFSEDLLEFTEGEVVDDVQHDVHEVRVNEELERWLTDPTRLRILNGQPESILAYWKRQHDENNYRILPIAARVLFAIPASAAQIERDFGITGMLVTTHRTSIAKHNIDMCSFLNRNRRFVDVASCKKLSDAEVKEAIPANVLVALSTQPIDPPFSAEWEREITSCIFDSD
ncbi:hypothetical protein DVH05_014700 [Phytophthora capsici]|nr:hypothetical protein DVH05_014700 [Phytophthora capsici]